MQRLPLVDTHAHLDAAEFEADRHELLGQQLQQSIAAVICPALDAQSTRRVVDLAEQHTGVFAAVGIQPNYCAEAAAGDWPLVERWAEHPKVVAVGETGLDRHWDFTPIDVQIDYFERHLELARQRGLPVIIHCREAEADVLTVLRRAATTGPLRGVIHAFSGDAHFAEECLSLGLHLSFAGSVTYRNRKFRLLRDVAAQVPADRLLLETDSPYLVPEPLRGKQKRNVPANVEHIARCVAQLRSESVEQVARQTATNAEELFGLELPGESQAPR